MGNQSPLTGLAAVPDEISIESWLHNGHPNGGLHTPNGAMPLYERRSDPRRSTAYPALVRGVDCNGQTFEEFTHIDNISATGVFLRLPRRIAPGRRLFITFRFSHSDLSLPRVAMRGIVRRTSTVSDEVCGVGLELTQRRLLDKELRNFTRKCGDSIVLQSNLEGNT